MTNIIKYDKEETTRTSSFWLYMAEPFRAFKVPSDQHATLSYHLVEQDGRILSHGLFSNIMDMCIALEIRKEYVEDKVLRFFHNAIDLYFDTNATPLFIKEYLVEDMNRLFYPRTMLFC